MPRTQAWTSTVTTRIRAVLHAAHRGRLQLACFFLELASLRCASGEAEEQSSSNITNDTETTTATIATTTVLALLLLR